MTFLLLLICALAVMQLVDFVEFLVPDDWSWILSPRVKMLMSLFYSGVTLALIPDTPLEPHTVLLGLGVAGGSSLLHQAHRGFSRAADNHQHSVLARAQEHRRGQAPRF